MPTIKLKDDVYHELQNLIGAKLQSKHRNIAELIKGITFNEIVAELVLDYKLHHKIKVTK